jgi:hypothetical protein
MNRQLLLIVATVAFLSGLSGCGRTPPPATDQDAALTLLQSVLDAWKGDTSIDSFKSQSKDVVVADYQWQKGFKLTAFEIVGQPAPSGFDVMIKVKLSLQAPNGRKSTENAQYLVSTSKARVVNRVEPGS